MLVRKQCSVEKFHGRFQLIYQWENLYVGFNCAARFSAVEYLINPWNLNSQSLLVPVHEFLSSVGTFSERRWLGMVNGSLAVARKAAMLKNALRIKYGSFTIYRYAYCSCALLLKSSSLDISLLLPRVLLPSVLLGC